MNPIPMLLHCPMCGKRHVDRGEFATKSHHTHACQKCGHVWRPAIVHTVGVRFLPGFKDGEVFAVDLPTPPGVEPMEPGPTLITGLPVCDACYYPADTTLADLTTPPVPTCQRCHGAAASRLVKETTRCSFRRTNSPALEQCEREMGHAGSCQNGNASWFT
jgi:hypothetical protein